MNISGIGVPAPSRLPNIGGVASTTAQPFNKSAGAQVQQAQGQQRGGMFNSVGSWFGGGQGGGAQGVQPGQGTQGILQRGQSVAGSVAGRTRLVNIENRLLLHIKIGLVS